MRVAGHAWLLGVLTVALWLGASLKLQANDTMVTIGAGGLRFEQTDELRMMSEELYLSPPEIRVSYLFRNLTDHDVSGTVAFPLPEISVGGTSETPHEFHQSYLEGDIFDFHVEVNGQLVKPQADVHAFVRGSDGVEKEVTGLLRKYQLALVDPGIGFENLGADALRILIAAGVLMDDDLHHPQWFVRTTYHWPQVFPKGQPTSIVHRYKPVLGGGRIGPDITVSDPRDYLAPYCPDQAFASSVKKLPADSNGMLLSTELEYILKTGANWAGPIGRFRLEINKAGAELVSLCPIPGLKLERHGQSFVAESSQYTPTTDIKLLFAYRACDKAPCAKDVWPGFPR